jgi:beta-N-acetylhexosaminidase
LPHADTVLAAGKAYISGCADLRLSENEKALFAAEPPWGLILFKRNCHSAEQIRDLVGEFREIVGRPDAPILIDQEGGRVQRLGPPVWPAYPPSRVLGLLAEEDLDTGRRAAWLQARLIADDLHQLGITVDCLPVLDVHAPGSSDVIGDRSFGRDPLLVADMGRSIADGLLDGGVLPVVKHVPGHGRAASDSHHTLPVVDADLDSLAIDFTPFAALADLPCAMTSHVVYTAVDGSGPATTSQTVIRDIIRGRINFGGLLMSDDVSMNALSGDYGERARAIYAAGCDLVLHCNGRTEEMRKIAEAAPPLAGISGKRAARALAQVRQPKPFDRDAGREELLALAARGGWMRTS